jgi:hypothetical protein
LKRSLFLAAPIGLLLVSASPPEMDSVVAADSGSYPACSARIKDRCVQRGGGDASAAPAPAAAPRTEPRAVASTTAYPPCSATVSDRCTQLRGTRMARHAPAPRRQQLAYNRAGERG